MSKNITKSELIEVLASSLDISNSMAEKGINKVVERIVEKLSAGQGITLSGFELPIHIKQRIKGSAAESLLIQQADPEKKLSEVLKKPTPGHEKRRLQRRNFILDIEIYDRNTNQIIGDLGDITTQGIMLVSDDPIESDRSYSFLIRLPEEADEELEILFEAKSIQCRETIHESIYLTGFQITEVDEGNKQKIDYLINEYAV